MDMKTSISSATRFTALAIGAIIAPLAASAVNVSITASALNGNDLSVTAEVTGAAGVVDLTLQLGAAAPKDGDPASLMQGVATATLIGNGTHTFPNQHVVLGTKVAFNVVATDNGDSTTAATAVETITATDNAGYTYNGTGTGMWSDSANWSNDARDGLDRLGYPAYASGWVNMGGGTKEVHVDAAYSGLGEFHTTWSGLNLTLVGDTNDAALGVGSYHTDSNTSVTFDHIRIEGRSAYTVNANASVSLLNGAYLSTRWEYNINGDNAYTYVGSGSELYVATEWWYALRIDGANALLEIEDGTVRARVRFGQLNASATPKGIRFLGSSPHLNVTAECVIVNPSLPGSPVFEFVVPAGGYASAPIQKVNGDAFPLAGHSYQDHMDAVHNAPPIIFSVNEFSPFFSESDVSDILLVDWVNPGNCNAGINTDATDCGIDYAAFADPDNNWFSTDSTIEGVDATRVFVHLTGTGEPSSKTLVNSAVSGSVADTTLTVNATLREYDNGNGTSIATLYVGSTGPNGDPTTNMAAVATATLANGNPFSMTAPVVLGSQVAYAVIVENTQDQWFYSSSTSTNIVQVRDSNVEYRWVNNATGLWSDPANWTCTATDGKARLGYPSYGNIVRWYGNQTATVYVDGEYTDLAHCFWDNPGLTLTLVGTVANAKTLFGNTSTTANTHITLDGVEGSTGGFGVGDNGEFRLVNGAAFSTAWRCEIEGNNALLYVGEGCRLTVATSGDGYEYRLGLAGTDSQIIIDGGTVSARCVKIGKSKTAVPRGITFSGLNPVLRVSKQFRVEQALDDGGSPMFLFVVPESGWTVAPIQRNNSNQVFLDQSTSADIPAVLFKIDSHSPFLLNRGRAEQVPLVSWDGYGINTAGIAFDDSLSSTTCQFYYTPADAATKTGLWAHLQGHGHTLILIK